MDSAARVGPQVGIDEHEVVEVFLQYGIGLGSNVGSPQQRYRCVDRSYPELTARVLQLLASQKDEDEVLDFATLEPIYCVLPRGTLLEMLDGAYSSFIVYELEEVGLLTRRALEDDYILRVALVDPRKVVSTWWADVYQRLTTFAFDFVHTSLYFFRDSSVSERVHIYSKHSLDQYIFEHMSRINKVSDDDLDGNVLPLDVYTRTPMSIALQVQILACHLTHMEPIASIEDQVSNAFDRIHRTDPHGAFRVYLSGKPPQKMVSEAIWLAKALSQGRFDQYLARLQERFVTQNSVCQFLFNGRFLHQMRTSLPTLPESIDHVALDRHLSVVEAQNAAVIKLWSPESMIDVCRRALAQMILDVIAAPAA